MSGGTNKKLMVINKNATNADLKDISYYEDEREVLLFPFSIYEINEIQKKENYYIIYLNILGKYKKTLGFINQSDLIKSINQSKYIKMLRGNGILPMVMDLQTLVVHFISTDQSVQLSWVCKPTDIFSNIEQQLYFKYTHLYKNIFFLTKGYQIDTSATLEQNGIKDDDVILICTFD